MPDYYKVHPTHRVSKLSDWIHKYDEYSYDEHNESLVTRVVAPPSLYGTDVVMLDRAVGNCYCCVHDSYLRTSE